MIMIRMTRSTSLAVLPEGYHAQFLAEYTAAVEGALRPEQFRQLQELLQLWRLRAVAYSGPGYEVRLAADPGFGSSSAGATLTVQRATLTDHPHTVGGVGEVRERDFGQDHRCRGPAVLRHPAGNVVVTAGQATLCTVRLASATHLCSLPSEQALRPGRHVLTASCQGSADFAPSSAAKTLTVTRP
jgi:Family of unknown function (DUF6247)